MEKYDFMEMNEAGSIFFIKYEKTGDSILVDVYNDEECECRVDSYTIPFDGWDACEEMVEQVVCDVVRKNINYL